MKGNEEHRSIRITVDPNTRKLEVLQGYNDQVIQTQETSNTKEAYDAFIAGINGAGFTRNVPAAGKGDEAQSCPSGLRYNFEVGPNTENSFYSWSSSCRKTNGTFAGDRALIQSLFQKQIPNYQQVTQDVRLS